MTYKEFAFFFGDFSRAKLEKKQLQRKKEKNMYFFPTQKPLKSLIRRSQLWELLPLCANTLRVIANAVKQSRLKAFFLDCFVVFRFHGMKPRNDAKRRTFFN